MKNKHTRTTKLRKADRRPKLLIAGAILILAALVARQILTIPATVPTVSMPKTTYVNKPVYGISLPDSFARHSATQIDSDLANIKKLGFMDVRFTISWYITQPNNATTYNWSLYDRMMAGIQKNGLHGLAIIDYTPAWARDAACKTSAYCQPASPMQYATFSAAVAKRYAPKGLNEYEVWNEENIHSFWLPAPSVSKYVAVLKAAYPAIKQADPAATVLFGGMSGVSVAGPGYLEPRQYLTDAYASGAKPYFDVLGYHAYTFPESPNETDGGKNAWAKIAVVDPSLQTIMASNGDGAKKIWITEVGAPTNGPGSVVSATVKRTAKSDHVDDTLQASILTDVLADTLTQPKIGGLFWYTYQDPGVNPNSPENFYGLLNYDGSPKPAMQVFKDFLRKHQE